MKYDANNSTASVQVAPQISVFMNQTPIVASSINSKNDFGLTLLNVYFLVVRSNLATM